MSKTGIFVLGVGMTPFGKFPDQSVKHLTAAAVGHALEDATAAVGDVEAAYFANVSQGALEGQHAVPGQIALRSCGFQHIPIANVENACASGSTALYLAVNHLLAGQAEVAMAVGVEKMYRADRAQTFALFRGGWDVHDDGRLMAELRRHSAGTPVPASIVSPDGTRSEFMEIYAALAKNHMKMFGLTQRQLATVAAKNHFHSTFNPLSQYTHDTSVDEVLAARLVDWPITLPMCSPISDGAAAVILCTREGLHRFPNARPVALEAIVLRSGSDRSLDEYDRHACRLAAQEAYEIAGIGPGDISVAEVHDATAMGEIIQIENLGLCEIGEAGRYSETGATRLGGRIPVNPSGGLESKGHPLGATGLAQIVELSTQLRGEAGGRQVAAARFAIAENGGGFAGFEEASVVITILGRAA
ncbi:MAG: thiolase family protein [Betaproteobacteria bacterium]|nr:thiolase family protein [Betaproteobacteria bacterium]